MSAALRQIPRVVKHGQIEHLDLRLNVVFEHRAGQVFDQLWRVFIDLIGKIDRAGGERGHVGPQVDGASTLVLAAPAPSGRKLNDHARAMLLHACLHLREQLRIGRWAFVLVAHMDMHQRGAGLIGFVRRFDLLSWRHRHSRRLRLARQRAGDGSSDDGWLRHDTMLSLLGCDAARDGRT